MTLRLSRKMIATNKKSFLHNLLLTDRKVSSLCKASAYNSLVNMKLSKYQLFQIVQPSGFLGRLLEPLIKVDLSLIKNLIILLAKNVFIQTT